jgi:hypothetical protein
MAAAVKRIGDTLVKFMIVFPFIQNPRLACWLECEFMSLVRVDARTSVTTVASGFPSTQDAQGDLIGVADVAFLDDTLYAVVAGGGCSHGHVGLASGIAKVNRTTGA